jgi:hypothetical protein
MSKLSERKQIQAAIARREKLAVTSSNAIVTECLVCELFDSNEICTHNQAPEDPEEKYLTRTKDANIESMIKHEVTKEQNLAVKEIKEGNYLKNLEGQPLLCNGLIIDDRIFDQAKKAEVTQWILTNIKSEIRFDKAN